ncbi:MAG: MG2 domain-containing protein [Halothermotrichaceae bacterium]
MNRGRSYGLFSVAIIIISFLLLSGCSGNQDVSQVASYINQENNKIITHVTTGRLNADSLIAVRFDKPQIEGDSVEQIFDNNDIFEFDPGIEGKVFWKDSKTFVFKPDKPLLEKNRYIGTINLNKLFPDNLDIEPAEKVFEFETKGQSVKLLSGDFERINDDQSQFVYRGSLDLAETDNLDQVKKAVTFTEDGNEIKLDINKKGESFYKLESEIIDRTDRNKEFKLTIDKDELQLTEDYVENYNLSPSGMLEVNRIEEIREYDSSNIKLIFSDELDIHADYEPYVNLKPGLDIDIDVNQNTMVLEGDFQAGQKYKLTLLSGLQSKLGKVLATDKDYEIDVKISDILPKLEFMNSGVFLTSAKNKKISFRTMNLERVHIKVKKVDEYNIIDFVEENSFRPRHDDFYDYNGYGFKRMGKVLDSRILKLGTERNKWVQSQLDLSNVIDEDSGLYIIQLEYEPDDALYFPSDWSEGRVRDYTWENGKKLKHLVLSDLGITAKANSESYHVFVTDVIKAKPVQNAKVMLKDDSNTVLESGYTDKNGLCVVDKDNDGEFIEVNKRYQYSLLDLDYSRQDYSLFDVGGINYSGGVKAFTYTDRGVYRPGDEINLSVIARNEKNTFPENHPVLLKVYNPKGKLIVEKTEKEAKDGFYSFNFNTADNALTGNWRAKVYVGGEVFNKIIKIEEIVPYKIKVDIKPEKEELTMADDQINFTIASEYLFGSPSEGLDSETRIRVEPYQIEFNRYNDFTFDNPTLDLELIESHILKDKLDKKGKVDLSWDLPEIEKVPSALRVQINSKVLQKGGRPVPEEKIIPVNVYDHYVGIKQLDNYSQEMGSKVKFDVILASADDGKLIPDQKLKYSIYKMRKYWWWDYDSRSRFKKHYKSDSDTELIKTGEVVSREGIVSIEHLLDDYGEMLIEVEDPEGGHSASYFFRSRWWGSSDSDESPNIIELKTDKEKYYPGDTARLLVKTPQKGRLLVTVEKSEEIMYKKWIEIDDTDTEVEIPVTEELVPNAYIYASVFQPYNETKNDMPIRMYGVVPLEVEREDSDLDFTVETPESIEPNREFEVKIKAEQKAQFTVAVVDEGLLDITNFKTPDPWDYFFEKERLEIRTYDTFSDIIGLDAGFMYNTFSIGGGGRAMKKDYREKQTQPEKSKRFEPVAMFKGPVETDEDGNLTLSFKMPNYIGKVRVMVIGTDEGAYGSQEKDVEVKSPLMLMPTLPRVLGPGDKIEVPVTVFGMEDNLGEVNVSVETEGPVKVDGSTQKAFTFNTEDSKDLTFELSAKKAVGSARIKIAAASADYETEKVINLSVRPYSPYTYLAEDKVVKSKGEVVFDIPEKGLAGTTGAQISLSSHKSLNINNRLKWLIRYPYGCIEQTTSGVFPQLYLGELQQLSVKKQNEIDKNINAGIERLRKFQLSSGAFSYWPNGDSPSLWGTNYAGHFMIEAKRKGYHVPDDMYKKWLDYQTDRSQVNSSRMLTRAYRLYILALADEHNLSAMNYMRESKLDDMNNIAEYYLAAAYKYAGYEDIAEELLADLDTKVEDYKEFSGTYGSGLRDKAIILDTLTTFNDNTGGLALYNDIAEQISSDNWLSTQTTAYCLMAATKYLTNFENETGDIQGELVPSGDDITEFKLEDTITTIPVDAYGRQIKVVNKADTPIFATLEWEGIPVKDFIKTEDNNLFLTVEWLDDDGNEIDPTRLEQGTTFWGHFTVDKEYYRAIDEVALVQILPSGWEIENVRLLNRDLPAWMNDFNLNHEEYLDIRDDRIMWFFDFEKYDHDYEFVVKLNTVTVGEFYLPPTIVEAMYDNHYKATKAGKKVKVINR